jgi:hypothetical protein
LASKRNGQPHFEAGLSDVSSVRAGAIA